MKELYQGAELEIIRIDADDIITTSAPVLDDDELPPVIVA